MKIYLFSGYAGAGKSFCRDYFVETMISTGRSCYADSFAKDLKHIAKAVYGWDGLKDDKGRKLLQNIGRTGREYDIDMWVRKVSDRYYNLDTIPLAIDDWRYPNERSYLEDRGFEVITIRVHRPSLELTRRLYADVSETSLLEWSTDKFYDIHIENVGTLSDLKEQVYKRIILGE